MAALSISPGCGLNDRPDNDVVTGRDVPVKGDLLDCCPRELRLRNAAGRKTAALPCKALRRRRALNEKQNNMVRGLG